MKPTRRHDLTSWVPIVDPVCLLTLGIAWNEARYLSLAAQAFRHQAVSSFEEAVPGAAADS